MFGWEEGAMGQQTVLAGRVSVSNGLLAEITVNDRYGPGDLVPASDEIKWPCACWGRVG